MLIDAIILTGGRSSRLDSVPKSEFIVNDSTLLDHTLRAAAGSRRIVVVGHEPSTALPESVVLVREAPPFSGPVAAIAAGVAALAAATAPSTGSSTDSEGSSDANGADDSASDALLVLACDMPHISRAVPALLTALEEHPNVDGVTAIDAERRRQPLAAVYRTGALVAALEAASDGTQHDDPLAGLPMFRLLDHLRLVDVEASGDATSDVDTWDDAKRLGASPPAS